MQTYRDLVAKVHAVGGFIEEPGINWQWATFPSNEAAEEFHAWLDAGWETRGVYKESARTWPEFDSGVRFRRA